MWWSRRPKSNLALAGECNACGACCRDLILVDGGRPLRRPEEFRRLLRRKPEFAMFQPQERSPTSGLLGFRCERLGRDGRCSAYEQRPSLCRRYPTLEMFGHGAELPAGCSYRVVPRQSFATLLEGERRRREPRGWRRWLRPRGGMPGWLKLRS